MKPAEMKKIVERAVQGIYDAVDLCEQEELLNEDDLDDLRESASSMIQLLEGILE